MHSLKPTGLPPDSSRRREMKSISSKGVPKALWLAGEVQSMPSGTPRVEAISALTLRPGRIPPCPGLAPCEINLCTISLLIQEQPDGPQAYQA